MHPSVPRIWSSLRGRLLLAFFIALLGMLTITLYTFYNFQNITRNQIFSSFETVSTEMEKRIEMGSQECENVARMTGYSSAVQSYLISNEPYQVILNYNKAVDMLNSSMANTINCSNIIIFSDTGRKLMYSNQQADQLKIEMEQVGLTAESTFTEPFFSNIFYSAANRPYAFYFFPIYSTLPQGFSRSNRIVCAVLCDMGIMAGWSSLEYQNAVSVLLYQDQIVSSSRPLTDSESARLPSVPQGRGSLRINGETYLTNRTQTTTQQFTFLYLVPERDIAQDMVAARNVSLLLMSMTALLMLGCIGLVTVSIHHSVREIVGEVEQTKAGSPDRLQAAKLAEFAGIPVAINGMLDR
ncbi:hypothetical protein LJC63_10195, partial [Ruminococcaceae bacterium OttesenSCG-928-L11]|nr:hypothetical protein [Ruminococcaceae bacterium OttesenSCG-928-L11]